MANRWEKVEAVTDFLFLGSKITADDYFSHEIKRYLLLGWKAMTELDSVFPDNSVGKESACSAGDPCFNSWARKICWRRNRLPTAVFSGFPCGSGGKEPACSVGDLGLIPGSEDHLEKEMAIHSSTLAWKIPWTEESDRLQYMGS